MSDNAHNLKKQTQKLLNHDQTKKSANQKYHDDKECNKE